MSKQSAMLGAFVMLVRHRQVEPPKSNSFNHQLIKKYQIFLAAEVFCYSKMYSDDENT